MSKTTVYVLQHAGPETPGHLAEVLTEHDIGMEYIRPFEGGRVPQELGGHAGLVVMGGPMGVYEQAAYPFLRDELHLIERALQASKPVLGICLGSQLLAAALGAEVRKGRQKEIGWHPLTLTEAAAKDELFSGLPASVTAFHWHGDVFDLPAGAVSLARSRLTDCQAFRFGGAALGLLCHLEVTQQILSDMVKAFRQELFDCGLAEAPILEGIPIHLKPLQEVGRKVFAGWARLLTGGEASTEANEGNEGI